MGINVRAIVRKTINNISADETIILYRSCGNTNIKGLVTPNYEEPINIKAQVQSVSDAVLKHINRVNDNSILRNFYLNSPAAHSIGGIIRPLSRGGDMIQRSDLSWWLVEAVAEDFSTLNSIAGGWVCVRAVLQNKGIESL